MEGPYGDPFSLLHLEMLFCCAYRAVFLRCFLRPYFLWTAAMVFSRVEVLDDARVGRIVEVLDAARVGMVS